MPKPVGACEGPELKCATTATPAFDRAGRLWLIWTAASKVWVAHATAADGPVGAPVAVTPEAVSLDGGPDARPKIAIGRDGRVAVSFTVVPPGSWNGQIFTAISGDDGATFSQPQRLDPASPGHRFDALMFLGDGLLLAADIDKTNAAAAKTAGAKYSGAALALSWSGDGGKTFSSPKFAVDQACECCRIAVAADPEGSVVIAFRNVFDGTTRDHAVIAVRSDGTIGPVRRVSHDDWITDVCPHQGPALAVSATGTYHVAWYTAGHVRKGLFYARSVDKGVTFSEPRMLGRAGVQSSRTQVLATAAAVFVAWKEFDGETSAIMVQSSSDDGASWSAPVVAASTRSRADHPQLVANAKGDAFLSWLTDDEGYRLIALQSRR